MALKFWSYVDIFLSQSIFLVSVIVPSHPLTILILDDFETLKFLPPLCKYHGLRHHVWFRQFQHHLVAHQNDGMSNMSKNLLTSMSLGFTICKISTEIFPGPLMVITDSIIKKNSSSHSWKPVDFKAGRLHFIRTFLCYWS